MNDGSTDDPSNGFLRILVAEAISRALFRQLAAGQQQHVSRVRANSRTFR